jgi:hypothetical protein
VVSSALAEKKSLLVVCTLVFRFAFASVYRALIVPGRISDEVLIRFTQKLGFGEEDCRAFCKLTSDPALELAGLDA